MITTEELINLIENNTTERNLKSVAENLIEAINDWPTENLKEPSELISKLKKQVIGKLTFENINCFFKTLSVDKDAWKMESLNSILEIFRIEKNENIEAEIELEMILEKITNR